MFEGRDGRIYPQALQPERMLGINTELTVKPVSVTINEQEISVQRTMPILLMSEQYEQRLREEDQDNENFTNPVDQREESNA